MSSGNTCQRVVGRLLEIRVDAGYRSPADVDAMIAMMKSVLDQLPAHERIIVAADWRRCTVFGAGTAERAIAMFNASNPRTLRSAILIVPDSPTSVMQVMRLVSEARLPDRRVFTSPETQIQWLAEVTTPKELDRLKEFVAR
jgi:hypothetical protein